uniref:Cyclin-like domain-containing protein n=1 Tax=Monopterus albus TaxID=43700 RepID=A0A3Q3K3S3_MONAL
MKESKENLSVTGQAALDHIKPCWYWDKKDLAHTPSQSEGLDPGTEARYRREGARFIFDVGTRLGLHYDTLATGIIYFHRFYMFHSFKQFPRYVTGACCLFLAGKVEETPKKCKDIIKTARSLLNDVQFAQFGDDPKEEVMVLERILLQTIKFDLQVEHPYMFLLRYVKQLKGEKNKVCKVLQMAWTFVNDSLCTMLSLQWEPEIIAVAVMYLAGRLCKFDIQEWTTKQSSRRWWEQFVQDVPVELLEGTRHKLFLFAVCLSLDRKAPVPAPAPPMEAEPGSETAPPPPNAPPPHQPPPLPHRPPPPPPSNYIMSTTSSYMSGEGYQSLQSMMKTEGPSYAPMPPNYAPPMPPYHPHVYPPPAAPPPGPPPPPSNYPPPTYPPPGYNSYPPPPPPRMPPGHVPPPGIGLPPAGYPPPPPVPPAQSQVPLPPPPGMPLNRGGWMR